MLALFATLAYTGFRIAARNTDPWLKLVVATSTTWLVAQAAINIGYVVGLLPVTGLQLPLISSGGTSLVVTMFVFGMLANAARHEPEAIAALKRMARGQAGQGGRPGCCGCPRRSPFRAPRHRRAGGCRRSGARSDDRLRRGRRRGQRRAHRARAGPGRRRPPRSPGRARSPRWAPSGAWTPR